MAGRRNKGRKLFTADEDAYIRANYKTQGDAAIGKHLQRNKASVRSRAQKLGVTKAKGPTRTVTNYVSRAVPDAIARVPHAEPLPVTPAMERLARFDPIIARCVREREFGYAPGTLRNGVSAGHE